MTPDLWVAYLLWVLVLIGTWGTLAVAALMIARRAWRRQDQRRREWAARPPMCPPHLPDAVWAADGLTVHHIACRSCGQVLGHGLLSLWP